ncbi:carbohydrate ABC transporter permease [Cellulosilyticum sp. I15G10I2]|uniref:carbohydrate ABC transporter permease n=1 Tax=Cellulosilyticum sp. I15G10I2 TaxID=1892843 RepID=UPI00085BBE36|nr:carbohydrate ABC transporter permease [Cellulosilyticum sp. I15G10I2]
MVEKKTSKLGLGIIGIFSAALFLAPFYLAVINSLKTQKGFLIDVIGLPGKYFTLNNYVEAFIKLNFLRSAMNSLLITVISILLIIVFASMAAWMLVRTKTKGSTFIFLLLSSALLIPFQAVMLPLIRIMGQLNLLNPGGIIFMYLGFGAPLSVVLYHGFVKSVPVEIEEAAVIDGCNKFQIFWRVVFPLLKPITVTVSILNAMWIWNDFLLPQLVINKPEWQTIPLKMFYFFGQFSKRWDLGLAGLIIAMLPIIIFYLAMQKHIIKGVMQGSIK